MSTEQQTTIEWERGTQLAILRDAVLPTGTGVAPITLKAVLRAIDDHARRAGDCYATQETIAQIINAGNVRTIKRAIAVLLKMSLITCERRKLGYGRLTVNHYRIVWSELALLTADQSDNLSPCSANIKVTLSPIKVTLSTDQSDNEYRSRGHACHFPRTVLNENETLLQTSEARAGAVVADFENACLEISDQSRELSCSTPPSLPQATLGSLSKDRTMTQFRNTQKRLGSGQPAKRWQKPKPAADQPLLNVAEQAPPVPANVWNRNPVTGLMNSQWSDYDQQRIFDALCACGLSGALEILKKKIVGGCTVAEMDQIIEQWHQQKLWGTFKEPVGALHHRLTQLVWPCKLKLGPDVESTETPDNEADREKFRGTVLSMMNRGLKSEEIVRQALAKRWPLDKVRAWWPYQQLDFPSAW